MLPLALAGLALAGLLALALALCLGCRRGDASENVPAGTPEARVGELVEVFMPLDRTVTNDVTDAKFIRGQKLLAELSAAGPEVGHAALVALRERQDKVVDVERALLMVAARAATAETLPLLENLLTQYGASLDLRTEAALLLAEVAPERALVLLEPMVTAQKQNQTMPPADFLVKAWVTACQKTGTSPVTVLADVATNLFQDEAARVRAVKELAHHKDPRAEAALRAILVESTGDGYLRRMAVQSLHELLPGETACVLFRAVSAKEADMNFLLFLANVLEKWCG